MYKHTTFRQAIQCAGFTAALLLLVAPGAFAETFYKWQDETGTWVYGAHPPAHVEAVEIRTVTGRSSNAKPDNAATATDAKDSETASEEQTTEDSAVAQAPRYKKDKKLCEAARNNLEVLSSKAVVRQRDGEGNIRELSEEDRQDEMDRAKTAIDRYC